VKTLTAFYDLHHGPVSYDFVTWLVRAMMERDARGCERLHVVIVPKEDGAGGVARHWGEHDVLAVKWRLQHIVLASCPLADATVTLAASREQSHRLAAEPYWRPQDKAHLAGPIVELARAGKRVPYLQASGAACRYVRESLRGLKRPIVTLTLRHQATHPDRNSNRGAWEAFAAWLDHEGYDVLTLEDTNDALAEGRGYAELDPDLRLALYEHAAMNCLVSNGPGELLRFSGAPYLQFGVGLGEWRAHYEKHLALKTGEQLPWAHKDQRLVYRPDEFGVLTEEFQAWAGATS
jgi:hypothetical protein